MKTTPHIPASLEFYAGEQFREAHQALNELSSEQIAATMPAKQYDAEAGISYYILESTRETEEGVAMLNPMQCGGDLDFENLTKLKLLQDTYELTTGKGLRIIVFPNNSYGKKPNYAFTDRERQRIASGDFSVLADKQAKVAEKRGIEEADLFGYSMGSALAAELMIGAAKKGYFGVHSATFVDPANVAERKVPVLDFDFVRNGLNSAGKAIKDSALRPLDEITSREGWSGIVDGVVSFGRFAAGTFVQDGRAIVSGLAKDKFAQITTAHKPDHPAVIVRGDRSFIFPLSAVGRNLRSWIKNGYEYVEVEGYGHELSHNAAVFALSGMIAINGAQKESELAKPLKERESLVVQNLMPARPLAA